MYRGSPGTIVPYNAGVARFIAPTELHLKIFFRSALYYTDTNVVDGSTYMFYGILYIVNGSTYILHISTATKSIFDILHV